MSDKKEQVTGPEPKAEEAAEAEAAAADMPGARERKLAEIGVAEEQVNQWKQMWGRVEVAKVGKRHYIYRPLKRVEWREIVDRASQSEGDTLTSQEHTCSRCVVWPQDFGSTMPQQDAGIVATLGDAIMRLSGFGVEEEPMEL